MNWIQKSLRERAIKRNIKEILKELQSTQSNDFIVSLTVGDEETKGLIQEHIGDFGNYPPKRIDVNTKRVKPGEFTVLYFSDCFSPITEPLYLQFLSWVNTVGKTQLNLSTLKLPKEDGTLVEIFPLVFTEAEFKQAILNTLLLFFLTQSKQ